MTGPVLELKAIRRTFQQASVALNVLDGATLALAPGEIVGLLGPSGAGKSTLLHIAGLLERADGGTILVGGRDCSEMSDRERTEVRRRELGFVYQYHHLLPEFSALENVLLPQLIAGTGRKAAKSRAQSLLEGLGLGERLGHRPARLSGGEQQRVALARAVANRPRILLADEPTGNLDEATAELVFASLLDMVRQDGLAALIATHNTDLAARMDRVVRLESGHIHPAAAGTGA